MVNLFSDAKIRHFPVEFLCALLWHLYSIVSSKVRILDSQKQSLLAVFVFCFLDIRIRTIQLKHEGWGAFFGLQPARIILWASTH